MKKHLAATTIQKTVQGKQLRHHLIAIDEVISQLKKDGTPEEYAVKISSRLYKSLENGCLDLSYFQISDKILSQILPLLSLLNIKELNLGYNDLGPNGSTALAEALKTNTSLARIDLRSNQIGPEGATALAKALTENTSITELYLGDNNIENTGATALANALKINT